VIEGRELHRTRHSTESGAGTCVGRPVEPNVVRVIRISDAAISYWSNDLILPAGSIGEITVYGPTSTDEYFRRKQATDLAKIRERVSGKEERIVHRMGDLGYFDREGRLWFCGRKSHRVESAGGLLTTEQVEPIFNTHLEVRRTALVGLGQRGMQTPVLCVELYKPTRNKLTQQRIRRELENMSMRTAQTMRVRTFLFHSGFPVDIRHNAKIGREKLTEWAAQQLGIKA
jgi:olefin beta-lactone synthetase